MPTSICCGAQFASSSSSGDFAATRRRAARRARVRPALTPDATHEAARSTRRRLYLQLGVAGFAFGNIMLFSVPHYANGGPLDDGFRRIFDGLNMALALPVLLFSASDYFRTALRAVRTRTMAVEVPVALGLAVLFGRSVVDIVSGRGAGFLDSFAGLVFFLLIGRLFQQKGLRPGRVRSHLPIVPAAVGAGGAERGGVRRCRSSGCRSATAS